MFFSSKQLKSVDRLGAGLSLGCAIHCAAQPLLVVLLPVLGLGFLLDEQLETAFLIVSVALATWALFSGLRMHGYWQSFLPLTLGALFIVASRVFEVLELPLAVAGALCIASSHILNHLYQQRVRCHESQCLH